VLGCEGGIHRLEVIEFELGAGVESRPGQDVFPIAQNGVVLPIPVHAGQCDSEISVLAAPMGLKFVDTQADATGRGSKTDDHYLFLRLRILRFTAMGSPI
jgi:hypothetical protein